MPKFLAVSLRRAIAPTIALSLGTLLTIVLVQGNFAYLDLAPGSELPFYRLTAPFLFAGRFAIAVFVIASLAAMAGAERSATVIALLASVLAAVFLYADSVTYRLYRFHLDAGILPNLLAPDIGKDFFFSNSFIAKNVGIAVLLIGLHVLFYFAALKGSRRFGYALSTGLFALWFLPALAGQYRYAHALHNRDIRPDNYTEALPFFTPSPLFEISEYFGIKAPSVTKARAEHKGPSKFAYPLKPMTCRGPQSDANSQPLSLLVVVIDTLRKDAAVDAVMPVLARKAKEHGAITFGDHLSGGANTSAGLFSIFYGLPDTYWNAAITSERPPVLMDEMDRHNYSYGVYVSSSIVRPPLDRTLFARKSGIKHQADGEHPWQRDIASTTDFENFLQANVGKPFFSFLFYDSVHAYTIRPDSKIRFEPYLADIDYSVLGPDYDPEPFHNHYRQAAYQVDAEIARVFAVLERTGELARTVVIVTSDHGEEFNDNGQNFWGHGSNFSRVQMQVPLHIFWPGKPAQEISGRTYHYDLAPTLMTELFGCTNDPADYSFGGNLFGDAPAQLRQMPLHTNAHSALISGSTVTQFRQLAAPDVRDFDTWKRLDHPADKLNGEILIEARQRFLRRVEGN